MYNKAQKARYLQDIEGKYAEDYILNLKSLFNKTEKFEEMFEKDVSLFSREDISNMYSIFKYSSAYTYSNTNSRLSAYCSWCNEQMLVPDGCNHFMEINFSDFAKYINMRLEKKKYISREELLEIVKNIENPRDSFLLMCLFEFGKSENYMDIYRMKIDDIDTQSKTVKLYSGKVVKLSDELIHIAHDADVEEYYYFTITSKTRKYLPSDYIFKLINTGKSSVVEEDGVTGIKMTARIMKNISELFKEYKGINAASVAVSGQIDMIHRRSKELGIEPETYVKTHFDELQAQYYLTPDNQTNYWKKYKAYI